MRNAFTLIELLVVIAIIAVLAVVVVLTLNPAGLLQESRDSNRIQDMATLNTAISLSLADNAGESLGAANTVYMSVPDPTATTTAGDACQGLGLIALPAGYTYHCAASSTYRSTNGTGWIPLSLSQNTFGSSIAQLPVDSVNTTSSRLWYTYETDGNGKYEVTSVMESAKYQLGGSNDIISGDGGTLASVYEKGSKLGLEPLDYGDASLVGLWPFDEGSGTTAYDYSGNGNTGTLVGSPLPIWTAGIVGSGAINAAISSDMVSIPTFATSSQLLGSFSFGFWQNTPSTINNTSIWGHASPNGIYIWETSSGSNLQTALWNGGTNLASINSGNGFLVTGSWNYYVVTYNGSTMSYYRNGILFSASSVTGSAGAMSSLNMANGSSLGPTTYDDFRVYNRALSAAQIAAMYSSGK